MAHIATHILVHSDVVALMPVEVGIIVPVEEGHVTLLKAEHQRPLDGQQLVEADED